MSFIARFSSSRGANAGVRRRGLYGQETEPVGSLVVYHLDKPAAENSKFQTPSSVAGPNTNLQETIGLRGFGSLEFEVSLEPGR